MSQSLKKMNPQDIRIISQLNREKSVHQNLKWQIKQKEKKISFLEKYFIELWRASLLQKQSIDNINKSLIIPNHQRYSKKSKTKIHKDHLPQKDISRSQRIKTEGNHSAIYELDLKSNSLKKKSLLPTIRQH